MSIKIGVYESFSYIIPGVLYILVFAYIGSILDLFQMDIAIIESITIYSAAIFIIVAYVVGLVFDKTARLLSQLFRKNDLKEKVYADFKNRYPNLVFELYPREWAVLFQYLRIHNENVVDIMNRHNAANIMLRNIGFSLLLLSVFEVYLLIMREFDILHLVVFVLSMISFFSRKRRCEKEKVALRFNL
jgi:hypothetical protein